MESRIQPKLPAPFKSKNKSRISHFNGNAKEVYWAKLVQAHFHITDYHLEAITIVPSAEDGDDMLYLTDMLSLIGNKLDETKKYIFIFFRNMKDIVVITTNRPDVLGSGTEVPVVNKIQLTLNQKAVLKDYWRSRMHDRSTFHNIIENNEMDVIQDQPQTEHVHVMMERIFKCNKLYASALQESRENSTPRYLILIGHQYDLSVSNLRIFTFELDDFYRKQANINRSICLNAYHAGDDESRVLFSRRLPNILVQADQGKVLVDGQESQLSVADIDEILYCDKLKKNSVPGIQDVVGYQPKADDDTAVTIQESLVTIVEDVDDVKPVIIGNVGLGEDGILKRNHCIYGLKNGQVIPGIYIPVSYFGDIE